MKEEYDFSKGERGKFYRPNTKLNLPIYLEKEVLVFVEKLATKRDKNVSSSSINFYAVTCKSLK